MSACTMRVGGVSEAQIVAFIMKIGRHRVGRYILRRLPW